MSKVAIQGNASGTGTLTIAAPNTNSNYQLDLPANSGTLTTTGSTPTFTGAVTAPAFIPNGSSAPTNGLYLPAANAVGIATNSTVALTIDSSQQVGIGTTSPGGKFELVTNSTGSTGLAKFTNNATSGGDVNIAIFANQTATQGFIGVNTGSSVFNIGAQGASTPLVFYANGNERARIDTNGYFLVGKTISDISLLGTVLRYNDPENAIFVTNKNPSGGAGLLYLNRQDSDGDLVIFRQANTQEGSISVSGTTVSYNGGHLSRFAQTQAAKDESLLKGTVLSNLDEMNVYINSETGEPVPNEQLNKVKVSDVEGDVNVAGVFVNWTYDEQHLVDEINMAMTGDMIIRIAQGVVVQKGDLLMSAGDGTAKPQGDDIIRSKTVAKVTSNHVTCTYEDGSYCVPCVLMAC